MASIPLPTGPLENESSISAYLISVVSNLRHTTEAEEVAVYLLDPVTRHMHLRAWAAGHRAGAHTDHDSPHDLTDHGIDGSNLSVRTLRDFVHAAPEGRRSAKPLVGRSAWIGALVGTANQAITADADRLLTAAAHELGRALEAAHVRLEHLKVVEPESSITLPSEPIPGHGASAGRAYGPALIYDFDPLRGNSGRGTTAKVEEDRAAAMLRLETALARTQSELEALTSDPDGEFYDVVSLLFSTHVLMLTDEAFSGAIRSLVTAGQTPEDAIRSVVASFARTFRNLHEARLAEKAQDVRDIGFRLLRNVSDHGTSEQDFAGKIVLVEDILPSDLVRLALGRAAGVVILRSTLTAHIAILARSLGLPALVISTRTALEIVNDTMILLDADNGELYVSPSRTQALSCGFDPEAGPQSYRATVAPESPGGAHVMADGQSVRIYANVNILSDARLGGAVGADGIGLYRSEFPFIIRNDFVSEDDQYRVYRAVVRSMPGKPIVLRTADIGGDKLMAGRETEANPFLGVRGIRFSLANRSFFRDQLRAMLRAGHDADLRIMFPMVSSADELEEARSEVDRCIDALEREGRAHNGTPLIGAMVELPAAVIGIEDLAERTDFLSIGTNDLIMYLLAVDRTNERLSELYRSHHPVVLTTLEAIARSIGSQLNELSVCGESAADPLMIPFYLGIGIRTLSVGPQLISQVAATANLYDNRSAEAFARDMLAIRTLRDMDEFLGDYRPPEEVASHPRMWLRRSGRRRGRRPPRFR